MELYSGLLIMPDLRFGECLLVRCDRVALVIADVSDQRIAYMIRVTTIGELETTLTLTRNQSSCEELLSFGFGTLSIRCLLSQPTGNSLPSLFIYGANYRRLKVK
jgi:hypothetical protein